MSLQPVLRNGSDASGSPGRPCPVCGLTVSRPRATFCSDACRQSAFRQRHTQSTRSRTALSKPTRRLVVYQCPDCESRLLGEQRCPECNIFARRLGPGGLCPHCDEPVALSDLVAQ